MKNKKIISHVFVFKNTSAWIHKITVTKSMFQMENSVLGVLESRGS